MHASQFDRFVASLSVKKAQVKTRFSILIGAIGASKKPETNNNKPAQVQPKTKIDHEILANYQGAPLIARALA